MSRRLVANCDLCKNEIPESINGTSYILKKRHGLFRCEEMDICNECMNHIIGYIGFPHEKSNPQIPQKGKKGKNKHKEKQNESR